MTDTTDNPIPVPYEAKYAAGRRTEWPKNDSARRASTLETRTSALLGQLSYPGLVFQVQKEDTYVSLRVRCPEGVCTETGKPLPWNGRWWRLSPHMTDSEIVATAFKAVITSLEHEARETFKFQGVPIYDSHLSIYELAKLRQDRSHLDGRD